jgi:D-alanine-D-alanine ligase-like ATP-grasp enzyme
MIKSVPKSIKAISSIILAEEALKRGIKINHINRYQKRMAFLELSYKKHFEYIAGQNVSQTSSTGNYATSNKALTKSLLVRAKINTARGKLFSKDKIGKAQNFINKIRYPIVIKKKDGAHGDLVFVGIKNRKMRDEAISCILKENDDVLIEKEFRGKEYRIIATRNKFVAATYRDPANVVGDGIHNIKELIKIKNSDLRRGDSSLDIFIKIKIDDIVKRKLVDMKIKTEEILPEGKKIYLRDNSNISTGGDSIDVTNQVHSDFMKIAVKTIRAFPGLFYGGIDLMSNQDISKKPTKKSYIVLEVNSSPGISLHHFPYQGKSRNVAKEIIDILFPETKRKYV